MKAVGYVRVSAEEQRRDGWNLDADRQRVEQIAADNGAGRESSAQRVWGRSVVGC